MQVTIETLNNKTMSAREITLSDEIYLNLISLDFDEEAKGFAEAKKVIAEELGLEEISIEQFNRTYAEFWVWDLSFSSEKENYADYRQRCAELRIH